MSVYKAGTTYYYEFVLGRNRYRRKGFLTKDMANHAEKQHRLEVETRGHEALYGSLGPKLLTWPQALTLYTASKQKVGSKDQILMRIGWWAEWAQAHGAPYIQAMTREIIESGLAHLGETPGARQRRCPDGRSPQTQKHYKAALSAFYNKAVGVWGCMTRNPVHQIEEKIYVRRFKPRILERAERRRLILAGEPHMRQVCLMGLYTGMREMAIMGLQAEDFRVKPGWLRAWDYKPVRHGKPPEEYLIPLAPAAQKVFRELGVVQGPIWRRADGSIIRRWQRKAWLRALTQAGFMEQVPVPPVARAPGTPGPVPRDYRLKATVRFHDLRHMVGVALAEAGVPEPVIQQFMHHADREASRIYTKWVSDRALASAVEKLAAAHDFEE